MAEEQKQFSIGLARENLKKGFSSPVAKIGLAVLSLTVVGGGLLGAQMLRSSDIKAGAAQAGGLGVNVGAPRGSTDAATAKAVAATADEDAADARARGASFAGPFVFDGGGATDARGGVGAGGVDKTPAVVAALRKRAAEYDAAEDASSRASDNSGGGHSAATSGGGERANGRSETGAARYGVSDDAFKQIAAQLLEVGTKTVGYTTLANGSLTRTAPTPTSAPASTSSGSEAGDGKSGSAGSSGSNVKEKIAAGAGTTCAAALESSINTDFTIPVFARLLDCGDMTGARVKGNIVKGPDDYTLRFTNIFPDPKKRLKVLGAIDAVAVSIENDGTPGIADDVNNHWGTRLGSSALLSMANSEKQFLSARGTTSINTGTSNTTAIAPLSSADQRNQLLAGVISGGMDVMTRDLNYGVNRVATMTTNKKTLIGVQFLDDVKVVPIE